MTDAAVPSPAVRAHTTATPPAPVRPALRPRRWGGVVVWAALVGLFGWLWPRSHHTADVVAAYTRAGSVQGVLSHRGRLLLAASTLSLGPDKALTAEHVAAPAADGDWLYDGAFASASTVKQRWGFGYAVSAKGDLPVPDATWSAVVVPHWSAVAACGLGLGWHLRRFVLRTRERRWHRHGRCAACGYDLRGGPSDRCPECGAGVAGRPVPALRRA